MKTKEQFKVTHQTWDDSHLMDGLFGSVALLGSAMMWLILASVCIYFQATEIGYAFIGLASFMALIWVCVHVLPIVWKWFLKLVE